MGTLYGETSGGVQVPFLVETSGKQRAIATPYMYEIAEGNLAGHASWFMLGYNGALVANTEADVWSATGAYVFPTAAMGMEVLSSDNTQDIGTVIKGAVNNTVTSDAGGTTTTLVDADVDFTAATAVAVGDILILDPYGTSPEWGYITAVAATTLTCAAGFSSGGSGASRKYAVLDYSAKSGAFAVRIEYLDGSFAQKSEIVVLNGTTVVATKNTDIYRINSFRVIAAGSGNKPVGNLTLRHLDDTPVYRYITAGYTRARNGTYTVPAGKALFITEATLGYGYTHTSTHYGRIYVRANVEASTGFVTKGIFYPYIEVLCANSSQLVRLDAPIKIPAQADVKVSAIADYAGIASAAVRGWLETA